MTNKIVGIRKTIRKVRYRYDSTIKLVKRIC